MKYVLVFVCYHGFFSFIEFVSLYSGIVLSAKHIYAMYLVQMRRLIILLILSETAFTLKCCLRRQLARFWKGAFVFIHVGFGGWTQIRSGFCWHAETSVFHCHPVSLFSGKRSEILQKWILTESVVNWISQKTSCVSGFQFYSWPQRGTLRMKLDTSPQRTIASQKDWHRENGLWEEGKKRVRCHF